MDGEGLYRDPDCVICNLLPYGACDWHRLGQRVTDECSSEHTNFDAGAHDDRGAPGRGGPGDDDRPNRS